jgi:hypothetical protein
MVIVTICANKNEEEMRCLADYARERGFLTDRG